MIKVPLLFHYHNYSSWRVVGETVARLNHYWTVVTADRTSASWACVTLSTVYELGRFLQYTEIFGKDSAAVMETSSLWATVNGKSHCFVES